jgi:hypothetical protein
MQYSRATDPDRRPPRYFVPVPPPPISFALELAPRFDENMIPDTYDHLGSKFF